jgi:putative flippase GtrA
MNPVMTLLRSVVPQRHRKEVRRFAKFMIVGGIGFVVDTGTLNLLVLGLHLVDSTHRTYAKALSFALAVVSNFLWNRFWTYRDSRSKPVGVQLMQFAVVSVIGLGINLAVFSLVGDWVIPALRASAGPVLGLALGTNIAQAAAVLVVMFWNFFVNRFWTYGDIS